LSIIVGFWLSPEVDDGMANQLKMAEVQAILALARGGWSHRHIARQLGVHRETVGRHLRLSAQDDGGGEAYRSKPASAPIGSVSTAGPWREVILQKLDAGLTAQRIYQDLHGDHGYTGSYWSVRRLVKKLTAVLPAPFRRMECEPGAEAQVDFGRGAPIITPDGKRRSTWVCAVASESRFVAFTDDSWISFSGACVSPPLFRTGTASDSASLFKVVLKCTI
jgi:transposase